MNTEELQPEIIHDDQVRTPCPEWYDNVWMIEYDYGVVHLTRKNGLGISEEGDWDEDESPNCPYCGANILIAYRGKTYEPDEFFNLEGVE